MEASEMQLLKVLISVISELHDWEIKDRSEFILNIV